MPNALKPSMLNIRSYQVGFGDCFLLTLHYPKATKAADKTRHILIDFGSTGMPDGIVPSEQMMKVAQDIAKQCGGEKGKLHVVVATHRHKDHISGFATDGPGTGTVIKGLNPEVVIQPWTEHPDARRNAIQLQGLSADPKKAFKNNPQVAFMSALQDMNAVAEVVNAEVNHLDNKTKFSKGVSPEVSRQIKFLADDNGIPNESAVKNLAGMGKKRHYVKHGDRLNMERLLPGVKVHVLGPPTIKQYDEIKKQRSADKEEFWMLMAAAKGYWGLQAATGEVTKDFIAGKSTLFPDAEQFRGAAIPPHNRWFVRQMRAVRADQMLGIVRILDKALNNTSVILLFEVGGKKFLFPGDAQIENWEYALNNPADLKLLEGVDVYKVGHHGSRNATPRTLWKHFSKKSDNKGTANRLATVMSTMKGKHGHDDSKTEVPRATLVRQLRKYSDYHSTDRLKPDDLYEDIVIKF